MDLRHTRIACQRGVERRQRKVKLGVLRQVSRCDEAGAGDVSTQFGSMFAFDKFEQRRLPRAVRSDQTDALSALNLPIKIFEDAFGAEDEGDVGELNLNHGCFRGCVAPDGWTNLINEMSLPVR